MSCLCGDCECKEGGRVPVELEEYEWLQSTAEADVHLRDAAGRLADMAASVDFKPSDESRMWAKRVLAALGQAST